jgi:hypothetical protein
MDRGFYHARSGLAHRAQTIGSFIRELSGIARGLDRQERGKPGMDARSDGARARKWSETRVGAD